MGNGQWSISGNLYSRLTKLLNEELEDKWSVARDADSSTKADHLTKITLQKPDFVNINDV